MIRVILGAIVAGIVVFFWGAISHMALPIGDMGIKSLPGQEKTISAMKESIHERGFYIFPGHDMSKPMTASELEAYAAKIKDEPSGIVVFKPNGGEVMSARQLLTELGSSVVAALIAGLILTQVKSGYIGRVLIVTGLGLFGFVSVLVSYWNWYGFPTDFTTGAALDEVIGWFLAGLVLAAIIRPARVVKTESPSVA